MKRLSEVKVVPVDGADNNNDNARDNGAATSTGFEESDSTVWERFDNISLEESDLKTRQLLRTVRQEDEEEVQGELVGSVQDEEEVVMCSLGQVDGQCSSINDDGVGSVGAGFDSGFASTLGGGFASNRQSINGAYYYGSGTGGNSFTS